MVTLHDIDHLIMTEISVFDAYLSLDQPLHLPCYQIESSHHWNQHQQLLLELHLLLLYQDLTQFLCLSLSFVDLNVTLIQDVLVVALNYFCLQLFLYLVLLTLLLRHLVLLLFLFLLLFHQWNHLLHPWSFLFNGLPLLSLLNLFWFSICVFLLSLGLQLLYFIF